MNRHRLMFFPFVLASVLIPPASASAQAVWEVTPSLGWRTGASFDLSSDGTNTKLQAKDGFTAGLGIGVSPRPGFTFEASYRWQDSEVQAEQGAGAKTSVTGLNLHLIHGNFLFSKSGTGRATIPYLLLGLGATIFDPTASEFDSETRFSWDLGLGVKREVSQNMYVRLQALYSPAFINETDEGYWCDPYWGCWESTDRHYLDQFDFSIGLTKRFAPERLH